jgi:hypothetical protein
MKWQKTFPNVRLECPVIEKGFMRSPQGAVLQVDSLIGGRFELIHAGLKLIGAGMFEGSSLELLMEIVNLAQISFIFPPHNTQFNPRFTVSPPLQP